MFISFSSKHSSLLECLKSQLSLDTPTIKLLCPTRWTERTAAIEAILANYNFLCKLLVEVNERVKPVITDNWASEASPTLGCSIEISYIVGMSYVVCRMSVVCQINCVGGITWPTRMLKVFWGRLNQ